MNVRGRIGYVHCGLSNAEATVWLSGHSATVPAVARVGLPVEKRKLG